MDAYIIIKKVKRKCKGDWINIGGVEIINDKKERSYIWSNKIRFRGIDAQSDGYDVAFQNDINLTELN